MQALKKHGMHEGNMTALTNLAQLMYETMVSIVCHIKNYYYYLLLYMYIHTMYQEHIKRYE